MVLHSSDWWGRTIQCNVQETGEHIILEATSQPCFYPLHCTCTSSHYCIGYKLGQANLGSIHDAREVDTIGGLLLTNFPENKLIREKSLFPRRTVEGTFYDDIRYLKLYHWARVCLSN